MNAIDPTLAKVDALAADLKELHNQLVTENVAARIIADRARTVDQIKRLYAVIMAFALTTSVGNAYLCERSLVLVEKTWTTRLVIFGPVFCLGSILILFCLGAERFLDQKYVHPTSKRASRIGLGLDLSTLGATAGVFVVLANSFQPPLPNVSLGFDELSIDQSRFLFSLIILCVVDIGCLLIQYLSLPKESNGNKILSPAYNAHLTWVLTNFGMLLIFVPLYCFEKPVIGAIGVGGIAGVLVVVHLVRFMIDFGCGFELYYPPEELQAPTSLLQKRL